MHQFKNMKIYLQQKILTDVNLFKLIFLCVYTDYTVLGSNFSFNSPFLELICLFFPILVEDSEILRNTEEESQALGIKLHISSGELKTLEKTIQKKKDKLDQNKNTCGELRDIIKDRETENEAACKEISDIDTKILRADTTNSRLSLDLRKRDDYTEVEEVFYFLFFFFLVLKQPNKELSLL